MKSWISSLWDKQPVIVTILSSAAFWPILFQVLAAFGHPLSPDKKEALSSLGILVAGLIIHKQVIPASGETLPAGTTLVTPGLQGGESKVTEVGAGSPGTIKDAVKPNPLPIASGLL